MYKIDRRGGGQKSYTRTDPIYLVLVLELSFGRISFVFPSSYQFIRPHASTLLTLYFSRNDDWSSDRPKEERGYDGPAGMEPDGLIESNWDEVISKILNIWASVVYIF